VFNITCSNILPMRWWLVVYGEGNRNTDKTTDLQ